MTAGWIARSSSINGPTKLPVSACPLQQPRMMEALGVAHLHKSGLENGAHRAPGDICLLPLRPGQSYAQDRRLGKSHRALPEFPEAEARRSRGAVASQSRLHDHRSVSGQGSACAI